MPFLGCRDCCVPPGPQPIPSSVFGCVGCSVTGPGVDCYSPSTYNSDYLPTTTLISPFDGPFPPAPRKSVHACDQLCFSISASMHSLPGNPGVGLTHFRAYSRLGNPSAPAGLTYWDAAVQFLGSVPLRIVLRGTASWAFLISVLQGCSSSGSLWQDCASGSVPFNCVPFTGAHDIVQAFDARLGVDTFADEESAARASLPGIGNQLVHDATLTLPAGARTANAGTAACGIDVTPVVQDNGSVVDFEIDLSAVFQNNQVRDSRVHVGAKIAPPFAPYGSNVPGGARVCAPGFWVFGSTGYTMTASVGLTGAGIFGIFS